jgi:amino acid transporter
MAVFSALAAANVGGVRLTATVTNILTAGKLMPLLLLVVVGMFSLDFGSLASAAPPPYRSFSQAALLLVFTYAGFEGAVIPSGEMRDPRRHLPFALLTGFAVVTLVYISVQIVCIGTLPDLAHSERPLADAGLRFLGAPGASVIAAGALISIGGTLNALTFATPRLLFAMSENGQLPRVLSSTHSRFRTPAPAIVLTVSTALVLALFSTFLSALTISTIVRLMAYASTCTALPLLRRQFGVPETTFAVPVGRFVAIAAVALCGWLVTNSPWNELRLAAIAVLAGLALYRACARIPARQEAVPALTD